MKITVFTPTYNRGYIIGNAYQSLCRQTCKDFEWIVVDDGSTDNTKRLFDHWTTLQNGFPIRYFYKENGGKMRAENLGAKLAQGDLFLNLDSDDYLTDDAVATVIEWEKTISDKRNQFVGVAGQRCHFDGTAIGTSFIGEYLDAPVSERKKNNLNGDKVEVFYTDILRKYPFPEFPNEKFIAEGVTWMVICHKEKKNLRWFNKPLIKCEYRSDGYSAESWRLSIMNPQGVLYNCLKTIEICNPSLLDKLRLWHKYYLVGRANSYSHWKIRSDLELSSVTYSLLAIGHYWNSIKNAILKRIGVGKSNKS